ncbi:MAG TPA: thioredoxin family protein [archaeon]|nr:thioredoxin family protein [archaeon]
MNRDTMRKIMLGIILFSFLGSTFTLAILYAVPGAPPEKTTTTNPYVFENPLEQAKENEILSGDNVIVNFFYTSPCPVCDEAERTLANLYSVSGGKLYVVRINTDINTLYSSSVGVKSVPALYIKGTTTELLTGSPLPTELKTKVCSKYKVQPAFCS